MDKSALQDIFIKILRAELNGTKIEKDIKAELSEETLSSLYALSKKHNLSHIFANSFYNNGLLADNEQSQKIKRENVTLVYQYEKMRYAYDNIITAFNQAKIAFIPLKGAVIRDFYPSGILRNSCDVDILIKKKDVNIATKLLLKNGYKKIKNDFHDILFVSSGGILLELHFSILEGIPQLDNILKNAWDYAEILENCQYRFTDEFFVFYFFAHIAYHFYSGGCGIRSLMDVYVVKNKMNLDFTIAEKLLRQSEIYTFAKEIDKLSDICFSNEDGDVFYSNILDYIFSGMAYGTFKNRVAVTQSKKGNNAFVFIIKRLFYPYKKMVIVYPILKKLPILLPFCWAVRFFKMIFDGKTGRVMKEISIANDLSTKSLSELEKMYDLLGLKF